MKKLLTLIGALIISINLFAQAPQRMSYQAVIRNASNNLVINAQVRMRISILQGSPSGSAVYSELHSAGTNANGLVTIEIGAGTPISGNFSSINWGNGSYFLRTETDPSGGTNYTITGTSQLLSVPFALEANNAANARVSDSARFAINGLPRGGAQNQTLSWCNGIPTWGPCVPKLITLQASNITSSSAASGGTITDDGGNQVTGRGIVWSINPSPTIALNTRTFNGTGSGTYSSFISELAPLTTYYVRAYATNSAGTGYGNEIIFTTSPALPSITTTGISGITSNSAISGGSITNNGGANVTARGVVWSITENPTISSNNGITSDGSGTGAFASNISGLSPATTYFVRAYATNSAGTAYGNLLTFTTSAVLPSLVTASVTSITGNTAISGGNIVNNGGAFVNTRGVVWSTSPNPTIALSTRTFNGTGSGTFVSTLSGLQPLTTYYVRAYATNNIGTAYGNEISFTTTVALPTLTTTPVTSVSETGAISGGNITNNGGANVTARGVVWSTSPNPTIALATRTNDGSGSGAFASNLSGLRINTTYYVRAYATNSAGTGYGNEIIFTTITSTAHSCGAQNVHNPGLPFGTMTDQEGNVYRTIQIGNQTWMAENLRTTRYRNNVPITNITTDNAQWASNSTGAYCSYNNDPSNDCPYGKLYNWHAVANANQLCPNGWRVPTDADWTTLISFLGGDAVVVNGSMKTTGTQYWLNQNAGATNSSGFSGLPGGYRDFSNGGFLSLGQFGIWWGADAFANNISPYLLLNGGNSSFSRSSINRNYGFSVRCLRN